MITGQGTDSGGGDTQGATLGGTLSAPVPGGGRGRAPGPVGVPRAARRPTPPPFPGWLRVADSCQRSLRRPLPVAVDTAVGLTVTTLVTASASAGAAWGSAFVASGMLFGVWKRRSSVQAQGVAWFLPRLLAAVAAATMAMWCWPGAGGRRPVAVATGALMALALLKVLLWLLVAASRRRGLGLSRALVIGPEKEVGAVEYRVHLYPEAGLVCAHALVCEPGRPDTPAGSLALVQGLLDDHAISHVVCVGGDSESSSVMRDVVRSAPPATEITVVTHVPVAGAPLTQLGDMAVMCLGRPSWGTDMCKRIVDVVTAAALLVVLAPLLGLTALAVRLGDPGPAIFRQLRTGRGLRQFTIFKFRSMVDDAESLKGQVLGRNVADGILFKAADDPRITRTGAVIRRFSVDELPQLLNVIKGDMSLVGPRPLPAEFDPSDLFARVRHRVLPGITGLWQVKGANALSYEDMIDLDCAYVATRSLGVDLKILLQTLPAVLVRRDPY